MAHGEAGYPSSFAWLLATVPLLGFAGEYYFSAKAGALAAMLGNPTVLYGDWLLIPFNYLVPRAIDWRRGFTLFSMSTVSVALVTLAHAVWQVQGLGPFNFITASGVVTPGGWIHLLYSTVEITLLLALVFCRRKRDAPNAAAATALAVLYLFILAWGNYTIHHGFKLTDCVIEVGGLALLLGSQRMRKAAGGMRRQPD